MQDRADSHFTSVAGMDIIGSFCICLDNSMFGALICSKKRERYTSVNIAKSVDIIYFYRDIHIEYIS